MDWRFRSTCLTFLVGLTVYLLTFSLVLSPPVAAESYRLGIAPEGTSWFEGISAAFEVIAEHVPHSVVAMETGGTVDNAMRLNRDELDFGFVEMLVADEWYRGTGRFQDSGNTDARLAFLVGSTSMHWAVRADAGISTLEELDGRPFNPSTIGGGGEYVTGLVFARLGIEPDFHRMPINDAVEAVKAGRIVGLSYNGTPPVPLFADLHAVQPLRLLSLSDEQVETVVSALPFLRPRVIPAGSYEGMPDVQTVGIFAGIAATSRIPEDVVYDVTRAYWEQHGAVVAVLPSAGEVGPKDVIDAATIPLHAGAVRYYREIGLDIPDALIPPEAR